MQNCCQAGARDGGVISKGVVNQAEMSKERRAPFFAELGIVKASFNNAEAYLKIWHEPLIGNFRSRHYR
jgi:hypothetical protein